MENNQSNLRRRCFNGYISTATENGKNFFFFYCLFIVIACLMVIVALTSVVLYAEQNLNKDILDLRINITIIMKDIENNCSKLLQKYPNLINLPYILPTCWRVHGYYRYAKVMIALLIIHDCISMYLVSGGPFSYFLTSILIGILSIVGVYLSQIGLILVIDFIYVILGFVIVTRLFNTCFTPLPPKELRTS